MLAATALFLVLLLALHLADPEAWAKPLSLFRDGPYPAAGYALFGLLLAVGGLHVRTYYRASRWRQVGPSVLALALLAVVAVTPSWGGAHSAAAFALLAAVFGTYAGKLWAAGSLWLYAHLAAPVAILLAAIGHDALTYGVWQKGLILYFLLAVNLDALVVSGSLYLPGPDDFRRAKRRRTAMYSPRVIWRRTDRPPGG
jgi:hypothetical protein